MRAIPSGKKRIRMREEIVVPFAPILVESIRSVGYSFESALSDIIDNSIGKESKEIYVMYQKFILIQMIE